MSDIPRDETRTYKAWEVDELLADERQKRFAVERENDALKKQLSTQLPAAPGTSQPGTQPTADSILNSMGEISAALNAGRMTAADAKARLYAHQIALSAMRTIDTANARRQKEERLRQQQTTTNRRAAANHRAATELQKRKAQRTHPRKNQPTKNQRT